MVLHRKSRGIPESDSLDRPIVEISVRNLDDGRKVVIRHREVVVLRSDIDASGFFFADGVIATMMPEGKAIGLGTGGECKQLMSQTDPHKRDFSDERANGFVGIFDSRRIGGTIGEKDAGGL